MATRKVKASGGRQPKAAAAGKAAINGNGSVHQAESPVRAVGPTMEEIRQRAYQLYLERGSIHGQDVEDWLVAERQLMQLRAAAS